MVVIKKEILDGGTENIAGIVGIGKAIEIATENINEYNNKLLSLRNYYIEEVKKRIPNHIHVVWCIFCKKYKP